MAICWSQQHKTDASASKPPSYSQPEQAKSSSQIIYFTIQSRQTGKQVFLHN